MMKCRYFGFVALAALIACGDSTAPTSGSQHWVTVSAGVYHSCGITGDGSAFCWGLNPSGALGAADSVRASVRPVRVLTNVSFTTVRVGGAISCGLTAAGRAYCWGAGYYGALGDGRDKSAALPVAVAGDHVFSQITVGFEHACALTPAGEAFCWGDNLSGQLGDGTKNRRSVPTQVSATVPFKSVSAGNLQTCAIGVDDKAYCWGESSYGEGGIPCDTVPCGWLTPRVVSGDLSFVSISAGNTFTCALSTAAEAWCWGGLPLPWYDGLSKLGVIGNGVLGGSAVPVKVVGNHRFTQVVAGTRSACAIAEGGDAFCWGANAGGELGIGSVDDQGHPTPTRVSAGIKFSHVTVGDTACGLDQESIAYCWATIVGEPDASGGILIQGLTTRPTLLPNPLK
jgi:alpha-tubulin suppressor-like RCC1 family protein